MADKDFLSQFSGDNKKPDSFKEEERVKVTKEKKPVNVKLIVIILAVVLAIVGLVLFFMLRPTIEVRNFEGENSSEVKAWIKQNEIETQGIIFREEYSFDYDEGYIISQSIEPGKKVRKDVKMDFVVSLGADPEELISVPDIMSMYKDELQEWIKENKLTKTKVMSQYSDDVESGAVISYEFKNGADAENFKRSSTLTINVSKGPQPAGTVTVDDFVKQDFSVVEAWGKKNKVEIIKTTKYDDKIAKDLVISQSIEAKKQVKEGESLTVVVSLGKGVKVPDFSTMSDSDIDEWLKDNAAFVKVKEMYSTDDSYIIEQSIATGKYIGDDNKLHVTKNLGSHFYLDEIGFTITGNSYDKFKDFCKELEEKGLYIDTHKEWIDSDKPERTILGIAAIYDDEDDYSEVERLPLEVNVTCYVSKGMVSEEEVKFVYTDFVNESLSYLSDWIKDKYGTKVTLKASKNGSPITSDEFDKYIVSEIKYQEKDEADFIDIRLSDGYLTEGTVVNAIVVEKTISSGD